MRIIETNHYTDIVSLLFGCQDTAGIVKHRKKLVDGLVDVFHHMVTNLNDQKEYKFERNYVDKTYHVNYNIRLCTVLNRVFILLIFLQKLIPLLVSEILFNMVNGGKHHAIFLKQLQRSLECVDALISEHIVNSDTSRLD